MTHANTRELLRELITKRQGSAATIEEVRAQPGTICEVDEETYFFYLEVLPPQFMLGGTFCFAEGAEPYLLFWTSAGRHFATQLTWEETAQIARLASIPLPGRW